MFESAQHYSSVPTRNVDSPQAPTRGSFLGIFEAAIYPTPAGIYPPGWRYVRLAVRRYCAVGNQELPNTTRFAIQRIQIVSLELFPDTRATSLQLPTIKRETTWK
jgi:hypothetical protein